MIQAAMYFALGLLTAGLIALLVTPAIWRRAQRLTRARIEAGIPLTQAEIDAEKDRLRADFAVSHRRLELATETLKTKLAAETIATGQQREQVRALQRERATFADTTAILDERIADLSARLAAAEERIALTLADLSQRDSRLGEATAALAAAKADRDASTLLTEELRLEIVARNTEIGNLRDRVAALAAGEAAAINARDAIAAEFDAARDQHGESRRRAESMAATVSVLQTERANRIAEMDRHGSRLEALQTELATARAAAEAHMAELETLRRQSENLLADGGRDARVAALEAELSEARQSRDAVAAEIATLREEHSGHMAAHLATIAELNERIRAEAESGGGGGAAVAQINALTERARSAEIRRADAEARLATAEAAFAQRAAMEGDNVRKALAAAEAEKADIATRLAALEAEQITLREENTDLRRVAGAEWESERESTRRLRERLNEIAAGVVRIAQGMDGAGSGAAETQAPVAIERATSPVPLPGEDGENLLSERLRALAGARH